MRQLFLVVAIASCGKSAPKAAPDDMDEKMRHCPLTVDGALATYAFEPTGTRWEVTASAPAATAEIQKRAKHVVEFAAGRSAKGVHGGGQGGGRMRNCPVLTSGVVITETDIPGGARLVVAPVKPEDAEAFRADTAARARAFSFPNVKVTAVP